MDHIWKDQFGFINSGTVWDMPSIFNESDTGRTHEYEWCIVKIVCTVGPTQTYKRGRCFNLELIELKKIEKKFNFSFDIKVQITCMSLFWKHFWSWMWSCLVYWNCKKFVDKNVFVDWVAELVPVS